MRRFLFIFLVPLLFLGASSPTEKPSGKVRFYNGPLTEALEKAREEGKLVFVDFYASWCAPCRLMDEYTFTDPELAKYMDGKYIPVKVNIDDFDGFAYKQQYNISLLPTLMVLNCEGREIERKEEGLVPNTLSRFLGKHYSPSNLCEQPMVSVPKPSVQAPRHRPDIVVPDNYDTTPSRPSNKPAIAAPPKPVVSTPMPSKPKPKPQPQITRPSRPVVDNTPRPKPKPHVKPAPRPSRPAGNAGGKPKKLEEGLFRFEVKTQPSTGYSVQTGAFGEYSNVLREVNKLQREFQDQPIIVFIGHRQGRTIYKVLVGEFNTRAATFDYKEHMKRRGTAGIIKNLAYIK